MVDPSAVTRPVADEGQQGRQPAPGNRPDIRTVLLVVIALVVVGWALRAASTVVVPVVASVLIALAAMPVRDWVRRKMPERFGWLGIVAAMGLLLVLIAVFFGALWFAAEQVVGQFPGGSGQVMDLMPPAGTSGGGDAGAGFPAGVTGVTGTGGDAGASAAGAGSGKASGPLSGSPAELASRFGDSIMRVLANLATTLLGSAVAIVSALVLIFFLTLLILLESGDWRRKIASVTHPRDEWRLTESADVIAQKVRAYLLIRAVLGLVTAALYGVWLWLFGVGLIVVWMVVTFLMNFVPTIGSLVAGLLPTIYAVVTKDFGTALAVGAGILVIEQVMGNYVDPKVAGNRIAISPLVVLVALLLWSWVWGIPGALLAVPVTVSLIVLGAHLPVLRPWALLLSDRTDMESLREATRPQAEDG